jgi:hypothetical protein
MVVTHMSNTNPRTTAAVTNAILHETLVNSLREHVYVLADGGVFKGHEDALTVIDWYSMNIAVDVDDDQGVTSRRIQVRADATEPGQR